MNKFFNQDRETLAEKRQLLKLVLQDRGVNPKRFLGAYDMFKNFPDLYTFDGATIVADFDTIKDLDASAMVHDIDYLMLRGTGWKNYLIYKLKADVEFGKNMRSLGVTWLNAWSRSFALILSTPFWMAYLKIKNKL